MIEEYSEYDYSIDEYNANSDNRGPQSHLEYCFVLAGHKLFHSL